MHRDRTQQAAILDWLLQGDPAIRWQTMRDLQACPARQVASERAKIATEGWGARLLAQQAADGSWGGGLYSPKWISTTYTLLQLRRFGLESGQPQVWTACKLLLERGLYTDGGINLFPSYSYSETCVTGMVLSLLAYFQYPDERTTRLVDYLLTQQMADGGWNCDSYKGARHSSLHTTISVLEGLHEFEKVKPYRQDAIKQAQTRAHRFLLIHKLFRSDHTGDVIDARMTRFSFPPRWRYDILRALDYLQDVRFPFDSKLKDALDIVKMKQRKDGKWVLQNKHPGKTFFDLEPVGKPSRWNTLRALRVLRFYRVKAEAA